tara:strand:- start:4354 stop:5088 length:735 start_codon:yes stop_codon:yes gene_type:complete
MDDINKEEQEQIEIEEKEKVSLLARLRGNFLTGLLVLMPLVLTLWIFKTLIFSLDQFMQSFIPIEHIQTLTLRYESPMLEALIGEKQIPGLGLLLGFVVIVFVGMLAKNVIGKKLFGFWDKIFHKTPLIRSIYSSLKQITNTISNTSSASFREVVLVEYPRKGCWVMAFVSGNTTVSVKKHLKEEGEDFVNVFVPTTPNPTSGFLIFVPRKSLKRLDMTVEQGLKLVISAGIVAPIDEHVEETK